VVLQFNIRPLF